MARCGKIAVALVVVLGLVGQASALTITLVSTNASIPSTNQSHFQNGAGAGGSGPHTLTLLTADDPDPFAPHFFVQKDFADLSPLTMTWRVDRFETPAVQVLSFAETVVNETEDDWTDFHITLEGTAFVEDQDPALDPEPVGVVLSTDRTEVDLYYAPSLPPVASGYSLMLGDSDGAFSSDDVFLDIANIPHGGTFTVIQYPTVGGVIPEPATLCLLGVPLAGLAWRRKRRRV